MTNPSVHLSRPTPSPGRSRRAVLLALALTATACARQSPPTAPPSSALPAPAIPGSPALALLPSDARIVLAARSLAHVHDGLTWEQLGREEPLAAQAIARELERLTGMNLLDRALFAELGLAADRPFGLAMLRDHERVL